MTTGTFRAARREEEAAIRALIDRAFEGYRSGLGRAEPWPMPDLPGQIAAGCVWCLDGPGGIAAALRYTDKAQEDLLLLNLLAVAPEAQGQGLGRRAVAWAEARARALGRRRITLQTAAKYDHLLAFYRSMGFGIDRIGPDAAIADGHDRAFLSKDLRQKEDV